MNQHFDEMLAALSAVEARYRLALRYPLEEMPALDTRASARIGSGGFLCDVG